MKKYLIILLVFALILSISFIGIGCKEEAAPAGEEVEEEAAEEVAEEAAEEVVEDEIEEPKEEITLTFWHQWGTEEGKKLVNEIVSGFEAEYPWIEIVDRSLPNENAEELLRNAFLGGETPDVYNQQNPNDNFKWADLGLVGDITDWYTESGLFPVAAKVWNFHNGKYWGVPSNMSNLGFIYYNKDIISENNIDVENIKTFDDFFAACDILKANGVTPIAMGNKPGWPGTQWFYTFICETAIGDDYIDMVFRTDKDQTPRWTDPEYVEAAQMFQDMYEKGYFSEGTAGIEFMGGATAFFEGYAGFFHTGSWYTGLGIPEDFNWGHFPIPHIPGAPGSSEGRFQRIATFLGGTSYSANTEYPEECLLFLQYISRPEVNRLTYTIWNQIPAVLGALPEDADDPFLLDNIKMVESLTTGMTWPEQWIPWEAGFGELFNGSTGMTTGQLAAEKWMELVETAHQAGLEE